MLVSMLVLTSVLHQTPAKPEVLTDKADLRVLTDGKKHYVVFNSKNPLGGGTYYGDGKTMTKLRIFGGGSGEDSWSVSMWDPRFGPLEGGSPSIALKETKEPGEHYEVSCGKKTTEFKLLAENEAKQILDSAVFTGPSWSRLPDRLLRDEQGQYYLIDRLRTEERNDRRDFRLFIGPKGKMKLMPLKDVVDDSVGMIFSTQSGELRLVADAEVARANPSLKWISGKSSKTLSEVPLSESRNARMVYLELGPYDGQRLGTPCDDLL